MADREMNHGHPSGHTGRRLLPTPIETDSTEAVCPSSRGNSSAALSFDDSHDQEHAALPNQDQHGMVVCAGDQFESQTKIPHKNILTPLSSRSNTVDTNRAELEQNKYTSRAQPEERASGSDKHTKRRASTLSDLEEAHRYRARNRMDPGFPRVITGHHRGEKIVSQRNDQASETRNEFTESPTWMSENDESLPTLVQEDDVVTESSDFGPNTDEAEDARGSVTPRG